MQLSEAFLRLLLLKTHVDCMKYFQPATDHRKQFPLSLKGELGNGTAHAVSLGPVFLILGSEKSMSREIVLFT